MQFPTGVLLCNDDVGGTYDDVVEEVPFLDHFHHGPGLTIRIVDLTESAAAFDRLADFDVETGFCLDPLYRRTLVV